MQPEPGAYSPAVVIWRIRRMAPLKVWARRMKVHRVTLSRLVAGEYRRCPEALKRLTDLLKSYDSGEWKFIEPENPRRADDWKWEGRAGFEPAPLRIQHGVNGFTIKLGGEV